MNNLDSGIRDLSIKKDEKNLYDIYFSKNSKITCIKDYFRNIQYLMMNSKEKLVVKKEIAVTIEKIHSLNLFTSKEISLIQRKIISNFIKKRGDFALNSNRFIIEIFNSTLLLPGIKELIMLSDERKQKLIEVNKELKSRSERFKFLYTLIESQPSIQKKIENILKNLTKENLKNSGRFPFDLIHHLVEAIFEETKKETNSFQNFSCLDEEICLMIISSVDSRSLQVLEEKLKTPTDEAYLQNMFLNALQVDSLETQKIFLSPAGDKEKEFDLFNKKVKIDLKNHCQKIRPEILKIYKTIEENSSFIDEVHLIQKHLIDCQTVQDFLTLLQAMVQLNVKVTGNANSGADEQADVWCVLFSLFDHPLLEQISQFTSDHLQKCANQSIKEIKYNKLFHPINSDFTTVNISLSLYSLMMLQNQLEVMKMGIYS